MLRKTLTRLALPLVITATLLTTTPAWAQRRGVSRPAVSRARVSGGVSRIRSAPIRTFRTPAVSRASATRSYVGRNRYVPYRNFGNYARYRNYRPYGGYGRYYGYYGGRGYYPWWGGYGYPGYNGYGYGYPSYGYGYSYPSYYDYGYTNPDYYGNTSGYDPYAYADDAYYPAAGTPAAAAAPVVANDAVLVTVDVPVPDADVWFDGVKMTQSGMTRVFTSPPLQAGQNYVYDIRARWTQNGVAVDRTRHVSVHAGDRITVDFTQPG